MFTKYRNRPISSYGYDNVENHAIRDLTIATILSPLDYIREFVPILAILNLCGVTHIRWAVLVIAYVSYLLIDYTSDLFEIYLRTNDEKKREIARREYYERQRAEIAKEEMEENETWEEEDLE